MCRQPARPDRVEDGETAVREGASDAGERGHRIFGAIELSEHPCDDDQPEPIASPDATDVAMHQLDRALGVRPGEEVVGAHPFRRAIQERA